MKQRGGLVQIKTENCRGKTVVLMTHDILNKAEDEQQKNIKEEAKEIVEGILGKNALIKDYFRLVLQKRNIEKFEKGKYISTEDYQSLVPQLSVIIGQLLSMDYSKDQIKEIHKLKKYMINYDNKIFDTNIQFKSDAIGLKYAEKFLNQIRIKQIKRETEYIQDKINFYFNQENGCINFEKLLVKDDKNSTLYEREIAENIYYNLFNLLFNYVSINNQMKIKKSYLRGISNTENHPHFCLFIALMNLDCVKDGNKKLKEIFCEGDEKKLKDYKNIKKVIVSLKELLTAFSSQQNDKSYNFLKTFGTDIKEIIPDIELENEMVINLFFGNKYISFLTFKKALKNLIRNFIIAKKQENLKRKLEAAVAAAEEKAKTSDARAKASEEKAEASAADAKNLRRSKKEISELVKEKEDKIKRVLRLLEFEKEKNKRILKQKDRSNEEKESAKKKLNDLETKARNLEKELGTAKNTIEANKANIESYEELKKFFGSNSDITKRKRKYSI